MLILAPLDALALRYMLSLAFNIVGSTWQFFQLLSRFLQRRCSQAPSSADCNTACAQRAMHTKAMRAKNVLTCAAVFRYSSRFMVMSCISDIGLPAFFDVFSRRLSALRTVNIRAHPVILFALLLSRADAPYLRARLSIS